MIMGLMSETLKYAYVLALPRLNFQEVYGPFALSASLMFWAFLSGLLLLTGAHLSAREHGRRRIDVGASVPLVQGQNTGGLPLKIRPMFDVHSARSPHSTGVFIHHTFL